MWNGEECGAGELDSPSSISDVRSENRPDGMDAMELVFMSLDECGGVGFDLLCRRMASMPTV